MRAGGDRVWGWGGGEQRSGSRFEVKLAGISGHGAIIKIGRQQLWAWSLGLVELWGAGGASGGGRWKVQRRGQQETEATEWLAHR